ncbi:hypothetical protein ACQPZG_03515 (plasmid) [Streptomyces sp. CA-294286]|uniref:hypothetical protein n=1 Tax=Streptomyces sp. CA-294286 TaxID=3240070 RepID=UPI003D94F092
MARSTHAVPRTRGPGPVWAVLLAVLVTLLGPSAAGNEHPRTPVGAAGAVGSAAVQSEPYADRADPAVPTVAVRGSRDGTGERHTPPLSAPDTARGARVVPLRPAQPPAPTAGPCAPGHAAHRHGVRAPPSPSGN